MAVFERAGGHAADPLSIHGYRVVSVAKHGGSVHRWRRCRGCGTEAAGAGAALGVDCGDGR